MSRGSSSIDFLLDERQYSEFSAGRAGARAGARVTAAATMSRAAWVRMALGVAGSEDAGAGLYAISSCCVGRVGILIWEGTTSVMAAVCRAMGDLWLGRRM